MSDIYMRIMLSALGGSEVVATVQGVGGSLSGLSIPLEEVSATAAEASGFLAALGDQAFTTGVGFNGLTDSAEMASVATEEFIGGVDLGTMSFEEYTAYLSDVDLMLQGWTRESYEAANAQTMFNASLTETSEAAQSAASSLQGAALSEGELTASADTGEASLGALAGTLGTIALALGAVVGIIGVVSTKAAGDFNEAMDQNVAHAGLAANQVDTVNKALLAMGPAVGQGPTQLATALYPILSGFSGISDQAAKTQISLTELDDAAKSVAGTSTSVTDVTNAATAAFNAYGLATNDTATNVSRMNNEFDIMNSTVSAGNMKWGDYSGMIGKLSVASHAAGVSFIEENAALADLTNQGYSAQLAGTYLSNTFNDLYVKADSLQKNAQKLGISFDENKYKTLDLAGRLEYLKQVTGDNQSELLKLMGGNSIALKTYDALSNSIGNYKSNLDALNHSQGATEQAFEKASSGFNFSMEKLKAAGQSLFITIGEKLLPVLSSLVNNALIPAVTWVTNLFNGTQPLSNSVSNISNVLSSEFGPSLQHIVSLISGQYIDMFKFAAEETKQFGGWFQSTLVPALKQAEPGFNNLSHVILDQLIPAFINIRGVVIDVIEHGIKVFGPIIGDMMPYFVKFEGFMANLNANGLKVIIPLVVQAAKEWGNFAKGIIDREGPIIKNIFNQIADRVQSLYNTWMMVWPYLAPIVKLVFTEMKGAIQFWWSFFKGIIDIVLDIMGGQWGKIWDDAKEMFKGMWEGIKTYLSGVWQFIVTLLSPIGKWFEDRWHDIQKAFSAIGTWFHDRFTEAWNAITGVFANIGKWFQDRWQDIVHGFEWLYNHNYYFKNLVDNIRNAFSTVINWIKDAWTTVSNWLVGAWHNVAKFASDLWKKISDGIRDKWNDIVNHVRDGWNFVSNLFSNAWNNYIAGPLSSFWSFLSNSFSNAWNDWIAGPVGSWWNNFSNTIGGLANSAYQWGINVIKGFVNGILSKVNDAKNAAGSIINSVGSILGFHSPAKEGEGARLMEWGPGLVKGFSEGMVSAIPTLKSSLNLVMQPVAATLGGDYSAGYAPRTASTQHISTGHTFIINVSTMARSQSEVKRMVDMIEQEISGRFLGQTSGYGSGGIY